MDEILSNTQSEILNILSTKKVLYAEDEESVAQNTIEILELFFQQVVHVRNGQEVLDEFEYGAYDVVIVDICMPGINGLQAIEQIRKKNRKIPIIILSAFSEKDYLWKAVELKIVKYLTKPYDTKTFVDALEIASMELVDYNLQIQLTEEFKYDFSSKSVYGKDNRVIRLSKNEAKLLEYLIQRKNQAVPFEDIYDYVWDFDEHSKEAIKSVVKELRKKIDKHLIKNIYGVGYTLEI